MTRLDERLPVLSDALCPPVIRGVADLATFAYHGNGFEALLARIGEPGDDPGRLYDTSIACQLDFRRAEGLNRQDAVLARDRVFRVRGGALSENPLRLLAIVGPGELMANTPLDFLTNFLDVRLDLLHVLPNESLPAVIPDHDLAFFAYGEPDGPMLRRLQHLFDAWPRPALNDPRFLPGLARDTLAQSLRAETAICSPVAVAVARDALAGRLPLPFPFLIRPEHAHAGQGLSLMRTSADVAEYLQYSFERRFYLTAFEDYASPDGYYRKSRVAFIDREPFLCHMAVSRNWMVHYLNAGMTECAWKRDQEARAMAEFDHGFARRHAAAFNALHKRLGFDLYSIDCAETRDGRLLVFEADAAAIIHLMDPEDMFPYKHPHMRRVFAAFQAMLRRRVSRTAAACPA